MTRGPVRMVAAVVGALAVVLVAGNAAMFGLTLWARATTPQPAAPHLAGIENLERVDERVWRGAAPTPEGYAGLAERGVSTVVDLRAEDGAAAEGDYVELLGMHYVHIPVRDGQAPTQREVGRFLAAVRSRGGTVFVHCGAGVGRTGTMAAAYLVATGQADAEEALRRNLAVGPPSLEQVSFVSSLELDDVDRPNAAVVALSRVLDAPRRLWARVSS